MNLRYLARIIHEFFVRRRQSTKNKGSTGFRLALIVITILRIGNWALPLFTVIWLRNRSIRVLFRLNKMNWLFLRQINIFLIQTDSIIVFQIQEDSLDIEPSIKSLFEGHNYGTQEIEPIHLQKNSNTFGVGVIIIVLVIFVIAQRLFGKGVVYILENLVDRKKEKQFVQEGSLKGDRENWLFFLIYALSFSLFLYQLIKQNSFFEIKHTQFELYCMIFCGNVMAWFVKITVFSLSGFIFNAQLAVTEYLRFDFIFKLVFAVIIIVIFFLELLNPLLFYFYLGTAIWLCLLLYKVLRAIYLSFFRKRFAVFDICIYLCALEILPLFVLYKLFF